jgi:hypothetical protein
MFTTEICHQFSGQYVLQKCDFCTNFSCNKLPRGSNFLTADLAWDGAWQFGFASIEPTEAQGARRLCLESKRFQKQEFLAIVNKGEVSYICSKF